MGGWISRFMFWIGGMGAVSATPAPSNPFYYAVVADLLEYKGVVTD